MKFKTIASIFAVTVWLAAASALAQSASSPATLTGTAIDSTGLALPGVTVTLTVDPSAQSEPLVQTTDGSGASHSSDQPGRYALAFS